MTQEPKLLYLPTVDSTNRWAKENPDRLAPLGAVWTTCQTAGRGRLGRVWNNASGQGLYYTLMYQCPMAQPAALPLFASLAAADALEELFRARVQIKWPNDLLLGGKKIAGILCEARNGAIFCGIGVNLCQPRAYFEAENLPHGTSLALEGCPMNMESAPGRLAARLTRHLTGESFEAFAQTGFAPLAPGYRSRCVNLGRAVTFDGGRGVAQTVDDEGRLVVRTQQGETAVFTGEVSVKGIYGALE
ncbi:MAG: biotin--[Oscillospiraceae bacterium]|nr:biotin--[acetyl-CoA-carboxylase] ligase [Oscillospiraceae bacterium]